MALFGLQKTTLIDFPHLVAATLFIPGCNLRCPYCHNPDLVIDIHEDSLISLPRVISFLEKRSKVLGGVCISGGEPLLYKGLPELIHTIHSMDLKVKIDTNGTLPGRLSDLRIDYISMDIKTNPGKYHLLGKTVPPDTGEKVKESIQWIISSGIPHEFRTTVAPGIVVKEDIENISSLIRGADKYILSQFRPVHTLDPAWEEYPPTDLKVLEEYYRIVKKAGIPCFIRHLDKIMAA
jgi:pyruvate formate lyase activating enzyme